MSNRYKYTHRAIYSATRQLNYVLQDLRSCRFYLLNLRNTNNPICTIRFRTIDCYGTPNQRIYEYLGRLYSALDYPIMLTQHFDTSHNKLLRRYKKLRQDYLPVGAVIIGDEGYDKAIDGISAYIRFIQALLRRISTYEPQQINLRGPDLKKFLKRAESYGNQLSMCSLMRLMFAKP